MKIAGFGLFVSLSLANAANAQTGYESARKAADTPWANCLNKAWGSPYSDEILEVGSSKSAAQKLFGYAERICRVEAKSYQSIIGKSEFRAKRRYQKTMLVSHWEIEIESRRAEAI